MSDDRNSSELDKDSQECKDINCPSNDEGSCTKDSDDYNDCENKGGD